MSLNPLLLTDVYKMGHMEQYKPGTSLAYSTLVARKDTQYKKMLFFGLQGMVKQYFTKPITLKNAEEFLDIRKSILGGQTPDSVSSKILSLAKLGHIPLQIKAVSEGSYVNNKNVILTVRNTLPEFYWVTGFFESLLLKIWYPITVATNSFELRVLMEKYANQTCDSNEHVKFQVHDFGYRSCASEEEAAIGGAAHLLSFLGTDTVSAVQYLKENYYAEDPIGLSVPASEHSVMCSFGEANEFEAFNHMLDTYPNGIVSIVSDTYSLWNVLENIVPKLKEKILKRNGKVVFRPDSGNQKAILCGNVDSPKNSIEYQGVIQNLMSQFGYSTNSKGYDVLNPKVGVIYGDGFFRKRLVEVYDIMANLKLASSNLNVGIGEILLHNHSRDDGGFSLKATYVEQDGNGVNIYKDPITDPGKKSPKGLCSLHHIEGGHGEVWKTEEEVNWEREKMGMLKTSYFCGNSSHTSYITTLEDIREKVEKQVLREVTLS